MRYPRGWMLAALVLGSTLSSEASAGYLVEVTYDDQDDGTGPATGDAEVDNLQHNFSSLGNGYRAVTLTGSARRSVYGEGYYGRGADLPNGGGAVRIENWNVTDYQEWSVFQWVKARTTRPLAAATDAIP